MNADYNPIEQAEDISCMYIAKRKRAPQGVLVTRQHLTSSCLWYMENTNLEQIFLTRISAQILFDRSSVKQKRRFKKLLYEAEEKYLRIPSL